MSRLPTPVFFYGMEPGQEISIEIERGKTLAVRLTAFSDDARDDSQVELFFELNGQPRIITTRDRNVAPSTAAGRKAEEGNPDHIAAPMPGTVSLISVAIGDQVGIGDSLLVLEAMKMETSVRSPKAGIVTEIAVTLGAQVESKDLLLVVT